MANESGYAISIKAFIPVDPADLDGHGKAIDAVKKAKAGEDVAGMLALAKIETLEVKPVTRRSGGEEKANG